MDPLTRRCMIVLSEELDRLFDAQRNMRADLEAWQDNMKTELSDTRKTVIAMMAAIIVTVVATGIMNAVWR